MARWMRDRLMIAVDTMSVQRHGEEGTLQTGRKYPQSDDEPELVKAICLSRDDPDALRPWRTHQELGQVANVWSGALLFAMRRKPEALDRFDEVLAEGPCPYSQGFFQRHPLPVPFNVAGVSVTIALSRSVAAIYAAVMYQMNCNLEQAMQSVAQAEPSDLATALKSNYAFALGRYDEVMRITQRTACPAETPFDGLALIFRGCAIREMGKPAESLRLFRGAELAASGKPEIMNRLNFEIGRSYAAQGNVAAARNSYVLVRWCYPDFPELDEAMAALAATTAGS